MSALRVGLGDLVVQLVTFSVFAIIGVVGNMRVLCIQTSIMRVTHLRYVAMSMASVDLAQCLLTIPAHLLLLSFTFTLSTLTNSLCRTIATIQRFLMVTSSCLLAVLSYERQEKVWHPFSSKEADVARVKVNIIVSFLVGAAASFCSPFYNGVLQYQVNTREGMETADLCLYDSSSQDQVVVVFSCTELAFLLAVFLFIVWTSGRVCYIMRLYGNTPLTTMSMISTNAMLYNSYCMQQQAFPKDDIEASMNPNLPSNYLRLLSSQMHTTPGNNTEEVKSSENWARISKGSFVFEDSIRMSKKRSKEKPLTKSLTKSCSYDTSDEQKMPVSWSSPQPPPRLKTLKYRRVSKLSDESTKSKSMNWAHFVLVLVVLFAALHLLPHGVFIVYLAFHPNPGIHFWAAQSSLLMSLVYRSFFLSCVFNPYIYFDSRIRYDLQRLMKLLTVSEDTECHANKLPLIQDTARATQKPTEPKKGVLKVKEKTSAHIK